MAKYILFDAHALGYYAQQGAKLIYNGRQVQSIFGFIRTVRRYAVLLEAKPIILWDGEPIARKALYPSYKEKLNIAPQSQEMRKQFRQQKDDIKQLITLMGIGQIIAIDGEADDLAAMLKEKLLPAAEHIYLYTGDRDWLQLIDDKTSMISMRDDRIIKACHFCEETGYSTSEQFIQSKALHGDTSDEISGVGGIGEKGAMELITEFGDVVSFIKQVRAGKVTIDDLTSRSRKKFIALSDNAFNKKQKLGMLEIFKRNLQLMDLSNTDMHPKEKTVLHGKLDSVLFSEHCHRLNFLSITEDVNAFLRPFR